MQIRHFFFCLCTSISLLGQSYQTSFSEVQFDRAKGPGTVHAGLEVDAASGALSFNIPFGPGIGARGAYFRPSLAARLGPQLGISNESEYKYFVPANAGATVGMKAFDTVSGPDLLYLRSFGRCSFSPGVLDLGTMVCPKDRNKTSYSFPGGGGGRVLGQLPPAMTKEKAQALLGKFGFSSSDTVGFAPGQKNRTGKTPLVQIGSDNSLIIGIRLNGSENTITNEVIANIQQYPEAPRANDSSFWDFPRKMVVVNNDVAYEYSYVSHTYYTQYIKYVTPDGKTQLYSSHYVLTSIRNKFGESIDFEYDIDGIGYTAKWNRRPEVQIRVEYKGPISVGPGTPVLADSRFTVHKGSRIQISYLGLSQPRSSYLLDVADPLYGSELLQANSAPPNSPGALQSEGIINWDWNLFDTPVHSLQPLRIYQEGNKEEIKFEYKPAVPTSWTPADAPNSMSVTPIVLGKVVFPTHTVSLDWQAYRFRGNYSPDGWGGMVSSDLPGRPCTAYGVVRVDDTDGIQTLSTKYDRVVPTSNWNNNHVGSIPPEKWVNFTFYAAITHPDNSATLHRFVPPPDQNALAGAAGLQNLAFIKTLEYETRHYASGVEWGLDLLVTDPVMSSAHKWVVKDRFDVRSPGAPFGELTNHSVPYSTRTRTWEKESNIFTVEELSDWDSDGFDWKTVHRTISISSAPKQVMSVEYLSLALQGRSYSEYSTTNGLYRRIDRTFEPKHVDWIFSRANTERNTTNIDNTGYLGQGVSLPAAQPLISRFFHSDINRVESVALSNNFAPTITTTFTFNGTSGFAAQELQSAFLSSPGLELSGKFGVSRYGYDGLGNLNAIDLKPNDVTTLQVSQESDELGRPVSQTDYNGTKRTITWDQVGRLKEISSSDADAGILIQYNDMDYKGITVTWGDHVMEYRYNGFGQLILERRTGEGGTKSHRLHGYDLAGRKTGTTVWLSGNGENHEVDWIKPNLTRDISITTTVNQPVCKRWGYDENGDAVCISWSTIPITTTTTSAALYAGTAFGYDAQGRVNLVQDANKTQTSTDYFGPTTLPAEVPSYVGPVRRITVGKGTSAEKIKFFENDLGGRLVRITTPVQKFIASQNKWVMQNLRTEYFYDGGDRIKEVKQIDDASRVQSRKWGYNGLGWLDSLDQPEMAYRAGGNTNYSAFAVNGIPTKADYNGRVIETVPDWMGRPRTISSLGDTSVSQSFHYDTAQNGKGRLADSSDSGVLVEYVYDGQGNRLSSLKTTVPIQGTSESFTQTFSYDVYGNRTSGTTSRGGWTQSYHSATGLPNVLEYTLPTGGTKNVAITPWQYYDPTSWAMKSISYGNGAASSFNYDTDQTRLITVKHMDSLMIAIGDWEYKYDQVGNLNREVDKLRPDGTGSYFFDQYSYDNLNRLISAVIQSPTYGEQLQQFDYDAFGNRTASSIQQVDSWKGARGESTAVVRASALLSDIARRVVNVAFTPGCSALMQNRLPDTTSAGLLTGATYNPQGNLEKIYDTPGSSPSTMLSMTYDALGRIQTVSNSKTLLTEKYNYNPEGLRTLVQEYTGATLQRTRVNIYNDARQLVSQYEKTPGGSLTWKRDILYLGTREAAEFDSAGMHVTQVDHLGSPRFVTGPTGAVESRQKYLPYGEILEQSGPFKSAKGYTSHEQTDSSGLIYMQARFYAPWYGRFLSPDPARDQHFEETQSWNIYSYTQNQPTMRIDPDGQIWNYVFGAAIGAVADAGTQFVIGYMQTGSAMQSVKNINLTQVAISAVEGAATSGASAIKGTIERIAVKSAIAVVSSAAKTAVDPNAAPYTAQQGVTDAVVSGVGGHLVEAGLNKVSQLTEGGAKALRAGQLTEASKKSSSAAGASRRLNAAAKLTKEVSKVEATNATKTAGQMVVNTANHRANKEQRPGQ